MIATATQNKTSQAPLKPVGVLLARLEQLANQAGEAMYERVKIAAELIDSNEFVIGQHGGRIGKAEEHLQARYFADLCGTMTVGQLRTIWHKFPQLDQWRDNKFNLVALYAKSVEKRGSSGPREPAVTRSDYEALKDDYNAVKRQLGKVLCDREVMQREIDKLKAENMRLKARIVELERMLQ